MELLALEEKLCASTQRKKVHVSGVLVAAGEQAAGVDSASSFLRAMEDRSERPSVLCTRHFFDGEASKKTTERGNN
jgi:hypothetical protein